MKLQFVALLETKPALNVSEIISYILNENDDQKLFVYLSELKLEMHVEQVLNTQLGIKIIVKIYVFVCRCSD